MYEVLVSPEAEGDLDEILRYLVFELENAPAASNLADKIEARLQTLAEMPAKFALCKDPVLRALGYHRVPVGDYLILYRIDEKTHRVLISHYYHSLQDYERDLLSQVSH